MVLRALLLLLPATLAAQPLVVLDPGHGGRDPGAVGCGLQEKAAVLDVGRRLRALLQAAGLNAAMTRDQDVFVELRARAAFANDRGARLFVSMHANANAGAPATGTETWIAEGASNTSVQLAGRLQRELVAEWGLRDRGVKRANFTVLTATAMPAALTEMGFINRCDPDARLLGDPDARQGIAAAHARAITAQLGVEAPPPPAATGVLRGVVFEDQGVGLEDPSVRLAGAQVRIAEAEVSARSAADTGAWRFELPPGLYTVTASLAGYRDQSRRCGVLAGEEAWCSLGLLPAAPDPPREDPDLGAPPPEDPDLGARPPREDPDGGLPDRGLFPPREDLDGGRPDVAPPRQLADGAVGPPREGQRPASLDAGPLQGEAPSGAFCAQRPGRPGGWGGLFILALLGLRRRGIGALLLLLPLCAQAHVPTTPPDGVTAIDGPSAPWALVDVRPLASGPYGGAILAPDGAHVLLLHRDGRALSVVGTGPGAAPRVLVRGPGVARHPLWYPDGRGVAVRTPAQSLAAIPLRGLPLAGPEEAPPSRPPPLRVRVEDEVVYVEEGGARYRLSPSGDRFFRALAAPDGAHVAFWGLRTGVHLVRLADGLHLQLGGGHPRFDPHGGLLVFERTADEGAALTGGDLFIVDLGRPRPQAEALTATPDRIELAPSIAGARVTFLVGQTVYLGTLERRLP